MPAPPTPEPSREETPLDTALRAAEMSGDLDRIKAAADIRASRAQERKATADARNAEAQFKELNRKRWFYERLLSTAQGTAVFALVTIIFQIVQFGYTARENRLATEDAQWKDVVKGISFDPDARSISSVSNLATFYPNKGYGADAKSLSAAIMPVIQNEHAFDRAFAKLSNETSWGDEENLYTVARDTTADYLLRWERAADSFGVKPSAFPETSLSDALIEQEGTVDDKLITPARRKEWDEAIEGARLGEWEIDTYTNFIRQFWKKNGTKPPASFFPKGFGILSGDTYILPAQKIFFLINDKKPLDLKGLDFSNASFPNSVLIQANLSGADLSGTNLTAATLAGADLSGIQDFEGSSWKEADWWRAAALSDDLCGYLVKDFLPPGPDSQIARRKCQK